MTHRLVDPVSLDQLTEGDEIQQSGFWGAYKAGFGARPFGFRISSGGHLLVLVRIVAPGLSLGYAPYGPDAPEPDAAHRAEWLVDLALAVRPHLPRSVVFLRFDLPWPVRGEDALAGSSRLRPAGLEIQPRHTVILDLGLSDERLLDAMHEKTRYNIRLASRRGVTVEPWDDLDAWYDIKLENDRRDGIVTHSRAYFRALLSCPPTPSAAGPRVALLRAQVGGRVLGGIIVGVHGRVARYLHGASLSEGRNTMFSYALQWAAIRWAREQGATSYDLYGIPPDDDPGHPMHGLYRFKTGFGGRILHRLGCHDVVMRRPLYSLLRLPERARYVYYKRIRRRLTATPPRASAPSP